MLILTGNNYWTRWLTAWCAILLLAVMGCKMQEHLSAVLVAMTGFLLWLSLFGATVLALAYTSSLSDWSALSSDNNWKTYAGIISIFLGSSFFFGGFCL